MMTIDQILNTPANTVVVEGKELSALEHLLVPPHLDLFIRHPQNAAHLKHLLLTEYPADHSVEFLFADGKADRCCMSDLDTNEPMLKEAAALHVPPLQPNQSFEYFQNVVAVLRSPDGCPWDRKQTHQSLRDDFLQEVYE